MGVGGGLRTNEAENEIPLQKEKATPKATFFFLSPFISFYSDSPK